MSKKEKKFFNAWPEGMGWGRGQRGRKAIYKCIQDSASIRKDCLGGAGSRVGTGPGTERMPGKHS